MGFMNRKSTEPRKQEAYILTQLEEQFAPPPKKKGQKKDVDQK